MCGRCCRRLPTGRVCRFARFTVRCLVHPGRTSRLSGGRLLWRIFTFLLKFLFGPFLGLFLRTFPFLERRMITYPAFCNLSQRATFRGPIQLTLSK